ncbi:MAG: DUF4007 family protein [Bacteroidia bacterium]
METAATFTRMRFSGHESFTCRLSWLRKGLDFVTEGGDFNDPLAVVNLGVGKNMVASIRYWLRAFGLTDETDSLTDFGQYLAELDGGKDPYFEKEGTIWLLLYKLISTGYASIYGYFANEFAPGRFRFTEGDLFTALRRKIDFEGQFVVDASIERDISVMLRTLIRPSSQGAGKSKIDIEEVFSGVLIDLELLRTTLVETREKDKTEKHTLIPREVRPSLPWQVVLYVILDQLPMGATSVSFRDMLNSPNSPGLVFLLSREGLFEKIEEITKNLPEETVFSQTAGNEVLQLDAEVAGDPYTILNGYYNN